MTVPAFQLPQPSQPDSGGTGTGSGADAAGARFKPGQVNRYQLSPEDLAKRIGYLDAVDRRCAANGRRCYHNAANLEFTVRDIDPATGEPTGEPYPVKSCARHRRIWEQGTGRYRLLSTVKLAPGRLKPAKREQRATEQREQRATEQREQRRADRAVNRELKEQA